MRILSLTPSLVIARIHLCAGIHSHGKTQRARLLVRMRLRLRVCIWKGWRLPRCMHTVRAGGQVRLCACAQHVCSMSAGVHVFMFLCASVGMYPTVSVSVLLSVSKSARLLLRLQTHMRTRTSATCVCACV